MPIQFVPRFCAGGVVDAKSYFAVAKVLCARPFWVADPSPDLAMCDPELRKQTQLPSGSRPDTVVRWSDTVCSVLSVRVQCLAVHVRVCVRLFGCSVYGGEQTVACSG